MSTITISPPDTETAAANNAMAVQAATQFTILSLADDTAAKELLLELKGKLKQVVALFAPAKDAANKAHKEICAMEKRLLTPLESGVAALGIQLTAWAREQERVAREEQRRLETIAAKEAEDRAPLEAIEAEEAGNIEEAEAIMAEPPPPPPVFHVPVAVAKVQGISSRKSYRCEVTDKQALIEYVAKNPEWASLLDVNMPNLNRLAKAQQDALRIPGVRAVEDINWSGRT